jgi:2-polyprenyl-3-methyl-5-hydroxy-6-metoxy-1,4-benzoquinol methylase
MPELQHVYERVLNPADPAEQHSLAKLARLIAPNSKVLDLGCGPGVLGEYLTRERGCTVDGVELFPEAARIAQRSHRRVEVGDLESFDFGKLDETYDYVVCADVLEHLKDPSVVARQLPKLLAKNGRILISIPNVAYAGLIASLINGEFRYGPEGLLDATHLRFFTRRSLMAWLGDVGLHALDVDTVRVELTASEFVGEGMESFSPVLREQLLSMDDALTYQFIVQAVPAATGLPHPFPVAPPPAAVTFLTKLYWSAGGAAFQEDQSILVRGRLGDQQRLRFPLPPISSSDLALRLDPSDRPGFLRLFDVALYDSAGTCVWKWDLLQDPPEKVQSSELYFADDEQRGQLMVATGNDPWLLLPVRPSDARALTQGGYLEVDMTWPASGDSLAIAAQLGEPNAPSRLLKLERQRQELVAELEIAKRENRRLFLERARFEHDRNVLEHKSLELEGKLKAADAQITGAHQQIAELRKLVDEINQSITFRAAKPVFAVVNKLKDLGKK